MQRAAREKRSRRIVVGLRIALVGACAVSLGLCLWQEWVPNTLFPGWSYGNRGEALTSVAVVPRTWYDGGSYNDAHAPLVIVTSERLLEIDPTKVHGDRFAGWVNAPPGMAPIQTDIAGGGYLVHISGVKQLGRSENGYAVVRRLKAGSGPVHVVLETKRSATLVLGWTMSIVGCLVLLAILLWTGVRNRGKRHPATEWWSTF